MTFSLYNPFSKCPQVLEFVKATLDLILGPIEGAIDYLINLLMELLIEGIPELKMFFTPFNFDFYWDDLINEHMAKGSWFRLSIQCIFLLPLRHQ